MVIININLTYNDEFNNLMSALKEEYGQELFDLDGIGEQLDMDRFSKNFFTSNVTADASVDANANVTDNSVIAYDRELPKPYFRLNSYYMLWKELKNEYSLEEANDIIEMQLTGDIYIHDFHGIGAGKPYCFNYSTYDIALQGLPMVDKIESKPPRHLYAFKSQVEQFVVQAANSTLGATGLADLLIIMGYYVDKILDDMEDAHFSFDSEKDIWNYVQETLVSMIYTLNQPMRANQSPFTNISVYDDYFLDDMIDDYNFPDGREIRKGTVKKIQDIFMETMNAELQRTPITFPITTACFSVEDGEIQGKDFLKKIASYNREYGFINIYIGKSSTLSSCCRLRSDADNEYFNSFGSGSSKIGSIGVVTINFPRLAREVNSETEFKNKLANYTEIAAKINDCKRNIVQDRVNNGYQPLYSYGFANINRQYSTAGVNGLYEALEILDYNIRDEEGREFAIELMEVMNEINKKMSDRYEAPHNCEQVPAENSSIKLVDKDRLMGYNPKVDMYSNQFIPLTKDCDMMDRLEIQGDLDRHFSGGAIAHINHGTKIPSDKIMERVIENAAKLGVVYFAINYNWQRCENGHVVVSKRDTCLKCGAEIEKNYTRVVGFMTDVDNWHKKRREEDYPNREWY